jgi:hypothetical protein
MATKKQRRRRQKERRHEYELVYVDDEGQEVDGPEEAPKPEKAPAPGSKSAAKAAPPAAKPKQGERVIQPPSWERVGKRALLFAPFIVIFFYLTRPANDSYGAFMLRSLPLLIMLVPFMYLVDTMAYRSYQKRLAKRAEQPKKSK